MYMYIYIYIYIYIYQNFFSKLDEIRSFLRSYLLTKPSMENFCLTNMYMYTKTMRN